MHSHWSSCASKPVVRPFWARNLGGEWLAEYVSIYRSDSVTQKNKEWIEKMEKKKVEWESTSASVYVEKG